MNTGPKFPHPPGQSSRPRADQQTNRLQSRTSGVGRPQAPPVAQLKGLPPAPPVYRPQPVPKVLQTKAAAAHQPVNRPGGNPVAPPVRHPHLPPKVPQQASRPQMPRAAQAKASTPTPPSPASNALPGPRANGPGEGRGGASHGRPVVQAIQARPVSRPGAPALVGGVHRPAPFSTGGAMPAARPRPAAPSVVKPPPAPAPVRPRPPFTLSGILQPKVQVEKINGTYEVTGRPAFQGHVKRELVKKWNANPKNKSDQLSVKGLSLSSLGLDQCHKVSWSDIRGWIQSFLNQKMTKEELVKLTDLLYGSDKGLTDEWKAMNGQRSRLIKLVEAGKWKEVPSAVSQLGSALNSATPNLRLDASKQNRSIQEHMDPVLSVNSKKQLSASPHTKELRKHLKGKVSTPKRTPKKGERLISSSSDDPVSKSAASPVTRGLFFK